jgi:hypothetical protein
VIRDLIRRYWLVDLLAVIVAVLAVTFVVYLDGRQHVADQRAEKQRQAICAILANIPGHIPPEIAHARIVFARPGHPADCSPAAAHRTTRTPTPAPRTVAPGPQVTVIVVPAPATTGSSPSRAASPRPTPRPSPTSSPASHRPTPAPTCLRVGPLCPLTLKENK